MHHNYCSDAVQKKLRGLGPDVDSSRGDADMEEDEEYRYVAVGE